MWIDDIICRNYITENSVIHNKETLIFWLKNMYQWYIYFIKTYDAVSHVQLDHLIKKLLCSWQLLVLARLKLNFEKQSVNLQTKRLVTKVIYSYLDFSRRLSVETKWSLISLKHPAKAHFNKEEWKYAFPLFVFYYYYCNSANTTSLSFHYSTHLEYHNFKTKINIIF